MNKTYDIEQVNVMAWLRFPLIIGVVLNHCNLYAIWEYMLGYKPDIPLWLIFILNDLYTIVLPSMVSTLFIISGYFFFRTLSDKGVNNSFFINKYKRRVNTLLIPYILWNCIAIIMLYIKFNIIEKTPLSLVDCLSGFWDFTQRTGSDPANGPLWYVRDLMVVTLLSPFIYLLTKNRKVAHIYILVLSVLYATDISIPVAGFSGDAFLFFSVGAYIAIHKLDLTRISNKTGVVALILYIPSQLFFNRFEDSFQYVHTIYLILCLIKITATFYLVSLLFRKKILKQTPVLSKISFLLYALHGVIITPIVIILLRLTGYSENPYVLLGIYLVILFVIISGTFVLYNILVKFTPKIAKIITGNRGI